jgi:hypothetical protein
MKAAALIFGLFISLAAVVFALAGTPAKSQIDLTPPERYQPLKQPIGPPAGAFVNDANEIWRCGKFYCSMWPRGMARFHQGR